MLYLPEQNKKVRNMAIAIAKPGNEQKPNKGNGGFEAQLFLAADKLCKDLEPSNYKHVVLGLTFLRHVSQSFEARYETLEEQFGQGEQLAATIRQKLAGVLTDGLL